MIWDVFGFLRFYQDLSDPQVTCDQYAEILTSQNKLECLEHRSLDNMTLEFHCTKWLFIEDLLPLKDRGMIHSIHYFKQQLTCYKFQPPFML